MVIRFQKFRPVNSINLVSLSLVSLSFLALSFAPVSFAQETPAEPAAAGWEVCNETSFILRVATASINVGKMSARGWSRLRPGGCMDVNTPPNTPRFVYAESAPVHQGGIREWKGKAELCASEDDFVADATRECAVQDLGMRGYLQIDPTEASTALVESENFGKKAYNAGLQRLLRDNGFSISRIDGILGRRTRQNLSAFLKEKKLPSDISDDDKIDALAEAAKEKQPSIGLTLCNETSARVWTAIAYREKSGWESRGWWSMKIGTCIRPFTQSLEGQDVHYFASQEQAAPVGTSPEPQALPDKKLKSLTPKPLQYCVADSQFSALGREYCSDKGYRVENFRAATTDEQGQKVILLDSDFVDPNPSGLRR